jgi:hypothetical protein
MLRMVGTAYNVLNDSFFRRSFSTMQSSPRWTGGRPRTTAVVLSGLFGPDSIILLRQNVDLQECILY